LDPEIIRKYCLEKKSVKESFSFGESTLLFEVGGRIFVRMSRAGHPLQFNVKCDPEKALELRESYTAVIPAYHMNKKHWNTIIVDGTLSSGQIREMIDDSYALVVRSLPLKERKKLM